MEMRENLNAKDTKTFRKERKVIYSYALRLFAAFSLCVLCVKNSSAQQVLLSEKYDPNVNKTFGANERNFFYTFYGFGYALGKSDTAFRLQYGWPNTYYVGL